MTSPRKPKYRGPVVRLLCRMMRQNQMLRATVRRQAMAIEARDIELEASEAHRKLAVDQRERARNLAAALASEPTWTPTDDAILTVWLRGEG